LIHFDPFGLEGHGFWRSYAQGALDDVSWGISERLCGEFKCDGWKSRMGYGLGTASSLAAGCFYGGTELKIVRGALKGLGAIGKGIFSIVRNCGRAAQNTQRLNEMRRVS